MQMYKYILHLHTCVFMHVRIYAKISPQRCHTQRCFIISAGFRDTQSLCIMYERRGTAIARILNGMFVVRVAGKAVHQWTAGVVFDDSNG